MGPADAGGQENGPRDEGSRAVGALQEGANAELGVDAQTSGGQATAGEMNEEGANDDDANGGHGIGFATPRDEANEETAANGPHRDDHRGGSPAYRRELPMSDGEANAPGAPQPLRRSARRPPSAGAPAVTRTCPRAEPARAAGPRSGGGSDQRTPVEQQVRSQQGVQEEADEERDRSPRCSRGPERRGNPSASAQGAPLPQEEPTMPISQAQQAAPVAATPRSGRGSTRGRGGGRGARGGQRSAGQASPLAAFARCHAALGPTVSMRLPLPPLPDHSLVRTYKAAGQQQGARRSSGSSVVSGRGERWDDARPGLAVLITAAELLDYCREGCCWQCQDPSAPHATAPTLSAAAGSVAAGSVAAGRAAAGIDKATSSFRIPLSSLLNPCHPYRRFTL
ncbi:unnamed protein product [Closterium sp. Naga37s-1]|nr:unnamed protein product [Closterium sp. Naga37s-1]